MAIAAYGYGTSRIYKWNTGTQVFDDFMSWASNYNHNFEFFQIDGSSYLLVEQHLSAESGYTTDNLLWIWNGATFVQDMYMYMYTYTYRRFSICIYIYIYTCIHICLYIYALLS